MTPFAYSAHLGYLFTDLAMQERVAAAARAGFAAIEHPAPYDVPAEEMASWLQAAGLRYAQLALPSGDATKGEKGLGVFPERREEFRASIGVALDYAETVQAPMVHAMAGILPPTQCTAHHWDCYVDNLAFASREAARRGITIIVEPMSEGAVPDYFIATPEQATRAIADVGEANVGLLLDVFHTVSAGCDLEQEVARRAKVLSHVHIADVPGRHEPGTGTVNFETLELALRTAGYAGYLGCEYSPASSTDAGLGWLHRKIACR